MRASLGALVVVVAVSLLTACGGGGGGKATPIATTGVPNAYIQHTGISRVDEVIDALAAADVKALVSLVRYTNVSCVSTPPLASVEVVHCPPHKGSGSLVPGFLLASCEGTSMVNPDSPALGLRSRLGSLGRQVYAVYRANERYDVQSFPSIDYAIVATYPPSGVVSGLALLVDSSGIVGMDVDCGYPPQQFARYAGFDEAVLPPSKIEKTPVAPALRHSGIPEVDAVIDAVLSGDRNKLRPLIAFRKMVCTATPQGIGRLYCETAEPDGTQVGVIPAGQCEGSFLREDKLDEFYLSAGSIFAVFRSTSEYSLVFSRPSADRPKPLAIVVQVSSGRVTSINYGCGETALEYVTRVHPQEFFLPPP